MHLWLNHDFTQSIEFDLAQELERGERKLTLAKLFADTQKSAAKNKD